MKRKSFAVLVLLVLTASCYLNYEQVKAARMPANVQQYMIANGIHVTYKTDCRDTASLAGNEIRACLQQTRSAFAYMVEHELGHWVYENDFCPAQIGGQCFMSMDKPLTIIREEQFAIDYAEAWGQLDTGKKYIQWLTSLDERDAPELILHYTQGHDIDYISPIPIYPTRIP